MSSGATPEIHHDHREVVGGWLRPAVFGMMDGLVSNFALIAGVAGAGADRHQVVLAGLAGLVGGAFSMATGEYLSVQSQNESVRAEIAVERQELIHNAAAEQHELAQLYIDRGVTPALAEEVARQLSRDPEQALTVHAREELGVSADQLPSAYVAAGSSILSFSVGAVVPLLPYLIGGSSVAHLLAIATVLALVGLFIAGAVTARFTSRTWWQSGLRQLLLGALAAGVTYGIGHLVGSHVG